MSFQDIINLFSDSSNKSTMVTIIVFCVFSLFQISPVDINPWSFIGKILKTIVSKIGTALNTELTNEVSNLENTVKDLRKEIATVDQKVQSLDDKIDVNRIKYLRSKILDFNNSLSQSERDKEDYDFIYSLHEEYEELLEKHGLTNGKMERAMKNIDRHYEERERMASF